MTAAHQAQIVHFSTSSHNRDPGCLLHLLCQLRRTVFIDKEEGRPDQPIHCARVTLANASVRKHADALICADCYCTVMQLGYCPVKSLCNGSAVPICNNCNCARTVMPAFCRGSIVPKPMSCAGSRCQLSHCTCRDDLPRQAIFPRWSWPGLYFI